jgi:hypothetical protein
MISIRPSSFVATAALLLVLLPTPAPTVTLDIGASTVGTSFFNQSFNETRAVDITVLGSDRMVVSMTLKEFNLVETSGMVGARIYDTATGTLVAVADLPAGPGFDQSITIPISALLQLGRTYRVGFFISAGCCGGSGDFIDANPSGLALTPYLDLTGSVQVTAAWAFPADVFPTNPNGYVPLMAIEVVPLELRDSFTGFYSPIDMGGAINTVKGGSVVPVKFNLFDGDGVEITDPSLVTISIAPSSACTGTAGTDEIEVEGPGATALRYDVDAMQFVMNWKTPRTPGECLALTASAGDAEPITAYFLLK